MLLILFITTSWEYKKTIIESWSVKRKEIFL